jgi:hypothetical protein
MKARMGRVNGLATVVAIAACTLASMPARGQHQEAEKKAVEAASAWLGLVDAGRYAESWDTAAPYFKNALTRDTWVKLMDGGRKPLGKLISRTVGAKQYTTSLPGAPDGQYVVVQFKTEFENKAQAIETVTPMLGKDGTWRVAGYYIR